MIVSLTNDLKAFVQEKVRSGRFPSEQAVVEAALRRLRDDVAALESLAIINTS